MSYVILECGSVARGDANHNSDRDIVCIWHGEKPPYESINKNYGETSFYSLNCIKSMKDKGSLFLTHLDVDSKCLDGNSKIANVFSGYRPSKNLIEMTLKDTINFINEIAWFPNSLHGYYWLCDVLYVSLRNCIFCINALNKRFLFGFEDAMQDLPLNSSEIITMLHLREAKYAYRLGKVNDAISFNIKKIEEVSSKIVGSNVKFNSGGSTHWNKNWRMDYWGERLIERSIINNEYDDSHFLLKLEDHRYHRNTLKKIMKKIIKSKT
ncbi:hypothetical protein [Pectobacterium polaris]|uniref:hypothetical protein n=1 Tax=Pectobacterium polaris TaxID=2042057 RepID=UPI000F8EA046|nr:hypothetical protein [Pectobacterium polaris]RUS02565.1 hypothetical protein KHDHEBDM_00273 [Pectobacterium polaris]